MTTQREACGAEYPHAPHRHPTGGYGLPRCPGVRAGRGEPGGRVMPAKLRRAVIGVLRAAKGDLGAMVSRWNAGADVYQGTQRAGGDAYRARRWDEYPENDPLSWRALERDCREIADALLQLAATAEGKARQIEQAREAQRDRDRERQAQRLQ